MLAFCYTLFCQKLFINIMQGDNPSTHIPLILIIRYLFNQKLQHADVPNQPSSIVVFSVSIAVLFKKKKILNIFYQVRISLEDRKANYRNIILLALKFIFTCFRCVIASLPCCCTALVYSNLYTHCTKVNAVLLCTYARVKGCWYQLGVCFM